EALAHSAQISHGDIESLRISGFGDEVTRARIREAAVDLTPASSSVDRLEDSSCGNRDKCGACILGGHRDGENPLVACVSKAGVELRPRGCVVLALEHLTHSARVDDRTVRLGRNRQDEKTE